MKVTQKNIRLFVKSKLATEKVWALRGLLRMYEENQTSDERSVGDTVYDNGIGFSGADSQILSSIAQQVNRRGYVTDGQLRVLHKNMPKYWKQIVAMSDGAKLNCLVAKHPEDCSQLNLTF